MNVRIEAGAMCAEISVCHMQVSGSSQYLPPLETRLSSVPASILRIISLGGHSISAVTPDKTLLGGQAVAY